MWPYIFRITNKQTDRNFVRLPLEKMKVSSISFLRQPTGLEWMNDVEPARCKGRVNVGEHTLLVTLFTFKGDLLLVGMEQLFLLLSVFWIFKYVYVCTLLAGTGKPARGRGAVVVVVINKHSSHQ